MLLIGIWLTLILLGLLFHKSKRLSYVQVVFIILLMGLSSETADYYTYREIYNSIVSGTTAIFSGNWLFNLFYYVFGVLTSYQFVIFITALIGTLLLYKAISYYTDSISLVLSLYLIAPFTIDATQQRNFLAMTVWLVFSQFLYEAYNQKNDKKVRNKNIIKYCIGVFLTMGIHVSFAVTFLFVVIVFFDLKKILIIVITFNSVVLMGVTTYLEKIMDMVREVMEDHPNSLLQLIYSKYVAYAISFNQDAAILRMEITVVFSLLILFSVILIKFLKKKVNYNEEYVLLDYASILNLVFLICTPLMFFSMEFYRIQRNLLIIDFIAIQSFITESYMLRYKLKFSDIILNILIIVPAAFYLLFDTIYWNFDNVFVPLFRLKD